MLAAPTRLWPRFALAALLMTVIFGGGMAAATVVYLDGGVGGEDCVALDGTECEIIGNLPEPEAGEPRTILLVGSDKRSKASTDGQQSSSARADTMMLVRLDPELGAMAVLSIPRDTKVEIPVKGGGFRTGKINEAYADGGIKGTIDTVQRFLDVEINHYVITQFGAFSRGVNKLGCFYQDIDRTYFNDNSRGVDNYATIDVKAGYQLLCGQDTLDWVRYRHTDSDFVRGQRQQDFLRSAKAQLKLGDLLGQRDELLHITRTYVQTDVRSAGDILSVAKAAADSRRQPVRSVRFRGESDAGASFVTVSEANRQRMSREFTRLTEAKEPAVENKDVETARKKTAQKQPQKKGLAPGLIKTPNDGQRADFVDAEFTLAAGNLPLLYPGVRLAKGGYDPIEPVRVYDIVSRTKQKFPSYRLTFSYGEFGQYWGVQGTTWKNPPILNERHRTIERGGRKLRLYTAGSRYRLIAWQSGEGTYWISNTLGNLLTNRQMLDIASGMRTAGS